MVFSNGGVTRHFKELPLKLCGTNAHKDLSEPWPGMSGKAVKSSVLEKRRQYKVLDTKAIQCFRYYGAN